MSPPPHPESCPCSQHLDVYTRSVHRGLCIADHPTPGNPGRISAPTGAAPGPADPGGYADGSSEGTVLRAELKLVHLEGGACASPGEGGALLGVLPESWVLRAIS